MTASKWAIKTNQRLIDLSLALGFEAAAEIAEGMAEQSEDYPDEARILVKLARLYRLESERLSRDEATGESPATH